MTFTDNARRPDFSVRWQLELGRHNSHDNVRLPVESQLATDNVLIAAESPLPQTTAQHHYAIIARHVLFRGESPAEHCIRSADLEETGSHKPGGKTLRFTFANHRETKELDPGDRFE